MDPRQLFFSIFSVAVASVGAYTVVPARQNANALGLAHQRQILTAPIWSMNEDGDANRDNSDDEEHAEESKPSNPYADPNYPELEFVNYDDPEYSVDQGDEFFDSGAKDTEEQIEEMREERRRRNDEYQFQTYYKDFLKNGDSEFKGEWTIYKSGKFHPTRKSGDGEPGAPELFEATTEPLTVVSRGFKEINGDAGYDIDAERIFHSEQSQAATLMGDPGIAAFEASLDTDEGKQTAILEKEVVGKLYWPEALKARDFRGEQGIMICGSAYTICTATPLDGAEDQGDPKGPYADYRAEVGIVAENMRFRVKLDYSVIDTTHPTPPLHLKSLTVCREAVDVWPRGADNVVSTSLFGPPGAAGGLYDPPPIKSEDQASCYLLMELEGSASLLFPYEMDQDPSAYDGEGWVTSLDWTAGNMRYQVDRKVNGGPNVLGLRTLELSEVQGTDAETYRPRDGGQDMRQ